MRHYRDQQWKAAAPSRLRQFIEAPTVVPGQHLPCKEWTTLKSPEDRFHNAYCDGLKWSANCPLPHT